MRERPPGIRAVEAKAESIDSAEHSGILKDVMAAAWRGGRSRSAIGWEPGPKHRRLLAGRCSDRFIRAAQLRSQPARHAHPTATGKRWCERPCVEGAGPPGACRAGVVHTRLALRLQTPWCAAGRQSGRPIAAILSPTASVDSRLATVTAALCLRWRVACA